MPCPQFSLKTMLWWVTVTAIGLAYVTGAFRIRASSLAMIHLDDYVWIVFAGWIAVLAVLWSVQKRLSKRW